MSGFFLKAYLQWRKINAQEQFHMCGKPFKHKMRGWDEDINHPWYCYTNHPPTFTWKCKKRNPEREIKNVPQRRTQLLISGSARWLVLDWYCWFILQPLDTVMWYWTAKSQQSPTHTVKACKPQLCNKIWFHAHRISLFTSLILPLSLCPSRFLFAS